TVDGVRADLVEHRLLVQPERVVAVAVELPVRQSTEVTDTRQRDGEQPVQELPHPVATQGHASTDRLALTQLELCDRLAGPTHFGLLPGDGGEVADRSLDQLAVPSGVADAHVHHDLHHTGNL